MTIPEVLASADGTDVVVSGTVVKINEGWSTQYKNITITIQDADGNELYVYRLATNVTVGDVITITGKVGSYNNAKQIAQGATATIDVPHVCSEYTEATCEIAAKCVVCGAAHGEPAGHTAPNADGLCDTCGANISVTYSEEPITVYANKGNFDSAAKSITWVGTNFTVTGRQGGNNNAIRTTDADHFRIYKDSELEITSHAEQGIAKIVVTCTSEDYAKVMAGSLKTAGATAVVDGTNVIITVTSGTVTSIAFTATAQFRINKVVVFYI